MFSADPTRIAASENEKTIATGSSPCIKLFRYHIRVGVPDVRQTGGCTICIVRLKVCRGLDPSLAAL